MDQLQKFPHLYRMFAEDKFLESHESKADDEYKQLSR